jgi:acyl carrier protein
MARVEPSDELRRNVLDVTVRIMREHRIDAAPRLDVPLGEEGLGFDSIGRLDLMGAIETECGILIPEKYWDGRKLKNLDELMRVSVARR